MRGVTHDGSFFLGMFGADTRAMGPCAGSCMTNSSNQVKHTHLPHVKLVEECKMILSKNKDHQSLFLIIGMDKFTNRLSASREIPLPGKWRALASGKVFGKFPKKWGPRAGWCAGKNCNDTTTNCYNPTRKIQLLVNSTRLGLPCPSECPLILAMPNPSLRP